MALSRRSKEARNRRAAATDRLINLKIIRANAPEQDRALPALTPTAPPPRPVSLFATTLEELRVKCGKHGEAAVQDFMWSTVLAWTSSVLPTSALTNSGRVVCTSVVLCQNADRVRLEYPSLSGIPPDDRLARLSPDAQAEARLVAAETLADWERAGRPYLTASRFKMEQQYILACLAPPSKQEIAA